MPDSTAFFTALELTAGSAGLEPTLTTLTTLTTLQYKLRAQQTFCKALQTFWAKPRNQRFRSLAPLNLCYDCHCLWLPMSANECRSAPITFTLIATLIHSLVWLACPTRSGHTSQRPVSIDLLITGHGYTVQCIAYHCLKIFRILESEHQMKKKCRSETETLEYERRIQWCLWDERSP